MIRQGCAAALALASASYASAEAISLALPVDCDLSQTCYIQQYTDRDPGPGATDYTCASLSYDGHKGTDFAVPTLRDMAAGVNVLAAAPGTVLGVRDGMDDRGYTPARAAEFEGRECGNGVVIQHADGWQTQYCHLKQGSVTVASGDAVNAGDKLGQIGQSGNAAFPHVHLSVRKDGAVVDPFDPDGTLTCNAPGDSTLWAQRPAYQPGGLLSTGFATAIPEFDAIKAGTAARTSLTTKDPAIVFYGHVFGTRGQDILRLTIDGPDGQVVSNDSEMPRAQAQAFRAVGKKRSTAPWPAGTYTGTATLIRDGTSISTSTKSITLH